MVKAVNGLVRVKWVGRPGERAVLFSRARVAELRMMLPWRPLIDDCSTIQRSLSMDSWMHMAHNPQRAAHA